MSQILVTGEAKIRDIQGPVVANSGVITALDGAASQYVRGDGTLADFPSSTGGGSSVSYYLNSSVSQGTIGGVAYRELSKEPIIGTGTDITIAANGYVANYITDANDPDVLSIPGGNFNCEFYFSVNNNTGAPYTYAELYKYNGTTFTLLGSSVGVPEYINQGTIIAPYYFAIPVPTSALAITDRLAIRIYVNVDGRTVTLHTENSHLCQVVTTLSKGMVSLNNLTDQSQYLTTGTSGTDFAIVSSGDTHTFNLPVASATNTGKLSSTDWSTFNGKVPYTGANANVNLGVYELLAQNAFLNGVSGLNGGNLFLRQDVDFGQSAGYTTLYSTGKNLGFVSYVGSFTYNALFSLNSLTNNSTRTYTLPDASGTIALTSNINYPVTSVFGRTGAVVAQSGDYTTTQVTEGTNLYYTDARARAALSFTAGSGAYNSTTGVITIPTNNNQITNGAGYITSSALSGYVPYTGATTNVNLGANSLTANQVIVGGAGVNNAGTFTTYDGGVATQLIGSTGNLKFFPFWNPSLGARINAENSAGSAYTPLSFFASNFYFHSNVNFNSTIGNGTYTYTLPSATGTLALLEGTQTFTGVKTFGALSNFDNVIRLKQNLALISTSSGYTTLFSTEGGGQYGFGFYNSGGALNSLNFPTASSNAYTFPAASGTVALTSNLSAYLPLTGGTLTGALSGTTSSFSGNSFLATSSGDVGVGTTTPNLTAANRKVLDINGTTESLLSFSSGGTNKSYIFNDGTNLIIQGATLKFQTGYTDRLTIASTGAATFSSSVTIGAGTALAWGARGGITQDGSWNFSWGTNSVANAFYIQSSTGNVGIGTSSPNDYGIGSSAKVLQVTGSSYGIVNATAGSVTAWIIADTAEAATGTSSNHPFKITTNNVERMRITSGGNVCINRTSSLLSSVFSIDQFGNGTSNIALNHFYTGNKFIDFVWYGSSIGSITNVGGTSVLYNTTSDYRLKQDLKEFSGLDLISKIKTYDYQWKSDKSRMYGVLAHELQEVVPYAVCGKKDDLDKKGNINPQGVDYSKIVPILVKAIQEQQAQIEELSNKIVALESK